MEEIFKVTLMASSDPNNVKKLSVPDLVHTKFVHATITAIDIVTVTSTIINHDR